MNTLYCNCNLSFMSTWLFGNSACSMYTFVVIAYFDV